MTKCFEQEHPLLSQTLVPSLAVINAQYSAVYPLIVQNSNFRHLFVNPFCAKLCGQRTRFILCLTIRLLSRKCGIKLSVNDSVLSIPHFAPIYWLQHLGDPMNDDIMLGLVQLIGTGTVHLKLVTNHS